MKTTYSRRDAIAVGALALIGTTLTGRTTAKAETPAQTPATASKSEPGAVKTRTASCNCGQLRVTCKGPDPDRVVMCNCFLCQKQTGSPFSVQARFPNEQVKIEGKSTAWKFDGATPLPYRTCSSSNGITNSPPDVVTSHFCPVCGSTVYYFRKSDPARTGVRVGAFADPTFPPPMASGLEEYQHPWVMNIAALPMPLGHLK